MTGKKRLLSSGTRQPNKKRKRQRKKKSEASTLTVSQPITFHTANIGSKQVSQKSNASRVSMKSRVQSEKEKKKSEQAEWDRSTNAS